MSEVAFHEKAGRSQGDSVALLLDKVFFSAESPPLSPPFHPHSVERLYRSVQVGCSRFSRCCHLLVDLHPIPKNGTWARRLTQSPKLGFGLWLFLSKNVFDSCGCRHRFLIAVVQRFVHFSGYPQVMQQHRQLPRHCDDRSLLPAPPAAL